MNERQLAIDNFNFFYNKLVESTYGFDEVILNNTKFLSAKELGSGKATRMKKELQIYEHIQLLFARVIIEYHDVARTHDGELPQEIAPKLEKICSIGELLSHYERTSNFINRNRNKEI